MPREDEEMSDDITQKLRVTMPDFKGLEISCPCRIRSLLMKDAADEIEKLTRERDEARAEMMEEAAKLVASWDEGGCECGGYGCSCGNFGDAVTAAVAATARGMANNLRARAETLRAKP